MGNGVAVAFVVTKDRGPGSLAAFVALLRQRAWAMDGRRELADVRGLVARLVDRAAYGSPPTSEQLGVAQVLDALRSPERASELSARMLDQLSAQTILELEALVDQIDRGLVTAGEIADALRRARLHAVPPDR